MLKAALGKNSKYKISKTELQRPGPSYMIHTVGTFRRRFPRAELFLVLGQDAYRGFSKWKDRRKILKRARLIVGKRKLNIASSQIRQCVKRKASLAKLVPPKVGQYIYHKNLYESD